MTDNLGLLYFLFSACGIILLRNGFFSGSVAMAVLFFSILFSVIGVVSSYKSPESTLNNVSVVLNLLAILYFGVVYLLPMIVGLVILLSM